MFRAAAPGAMSNSASVPQHKHPLQVSANNRGWFCDLCRASNSTERWTCPYGCNYDACGSCMAKANGLSNASPPRRLPQHAHDLIRATPAAVVGCDICRTRAFAVRWTCSKGCNWDACGSCCDKHSSTGGGGGPIVSIRTHSHKLQLIARMGYHCDICRVSNSPGRYRCIAGCDYDACARCVSKAQATMAADVVVSIPNHSHKLRGLSRSGYRCDICRVHNAPGRHRCIAGCDYDACASCIAKARAAATTRATAHVVSISAHSHKLQALARSGYRCDLCRTHNAPGRHRCVAGCDYDACGSCVSAYLKAAAGSASAAAGAAAAAARASAAARAAAAAGGGAGGGAGVGARDPTAEAGRYAFAAAMAGRVAETPTRVLVERAEAAFEAATTAAAARAALADLKKAVEACPAGTGHGCNLHALAGKATVVRSRLGSGWDVSTAIAFKDVVVVVKSKPA